MLAFPSMLEHPAKAAEIPVPPNLDDFEPAEFPRFHIFCQLQLARPMLSPGEHWENAKVIGGLTDEQALTITLEEIRALGFVGV